MAPAPIPVQGRTDVATSLGATGSEPTGFHVHLENFSGPFDLLLSLISKHKMDITEVALATVTDDFISYMRLADFDEVDGNTLVGRDARRNLGLASEFLLVAATLLDLKAARLLPAPDQDDQDALELLEARDVLFTKLLQYRAFKQLAAAFEERLDGQGDQFPRAVPLDPEFRTLLPPLVWNLDPDKLARLARRALGRPEEVVAPTVSITHLHAPALSVADEAPALIRDLQRLGSATFAQLVAHTDEALVTVVRFLILLELFRDSQVTFHQDAPLTDLHVTWVGEPNYQAYVLDDYTGVDHLSERGIHERSE